jgi:RHS repeat-associated protein
VVTPPPTFDFNIRFPGQYYDAESGLHDNRFRTYDPSVGRYISADPIGQAGGTNVFEFASSNPLNRADTLGLTSIRVNAAAPVTVTNASVVLGQPNYSYSSQGAVFSQSNGQVDVTDPNGNVTASFPARSGPWGQGALPQGDYTTAGPVSSLPNTKGNASYCDPSGNCWFQPLTPQFSTPRGQPGNGRFGFHPDGGVPGTAGCIGATQPNTSGAQSALGGLPVGAPVVVVP